MNLNLYQIDGKWLMVDCGAGFADSYLPGVDMIIPDTHFIEPYAKQCVALILTHAHEDHVGAVRYVWKHIGCPIYTTAFTAAFLRAKLEEAGVSWARSVPIHTVESGQILDLDPFHVEMVPLTHSAPEMHALRIRTRLGDVFHTGDWKFDHNPLIGHKADEICLARYGDEGVLAMVGDSTNVFHPGISGSEGDLCASIQALVAQCKQLVAVTTFASNIARIQTIVEAATLCGRQVVLAGRSLWRIARVAQATGYLQHIRFLDDAEAANIPRHELLILCTGCQGEALAATTKMAFGTHPRLRMLPGDTIIFSSKIIPGNEKSIFRLMNRFVKVGVEVLTEKDHFVHVSGHPSRDELHRMYQLIRPKIAVPVHGELMHLHEHVALAKQWGVPHAVQVENGSVVSLAPGDPKIIATVPAGELAVDGRYLAAPHSPVMRMRRRIQEDGFVGIVITVQDGTVCVPPTIMAPGIMDMQENAAFIEMLQHTISERLEQHMAAHAGTHTHTGGTHSAPKGPKARSPKQRPAPHPQHHAAGISMLQSLVRSLITKEFGKKPPIDIQITTID